MDKVRKCLTKAISPYYQGAHDCNTIKRTAFDLHVPCYTEQGNGFCDMATNQSHWDALYKVFMPHGEWGTDDFTSWTQVGVDATSQDD